MTEKKYGASGKPGVGRWVAWGVLLLFITSLYLMGVNHWHVLRLFIFIPLFFLLCLAVVVVVGFLQPGKEG